MNLHEQIEQQAEDIESLKGLLDLQGVIVEEQRQRIEELEAVIEQQTRPATSVA